MRKLLAVIATLSFLILAGPAIPPVIIGQGGGQFPIPSYANLHNNWVNSGLALIGGIPNRTTQCGATVNPSGLTPPVANDDAALINAAIAACTAGQVVQLGSGTFQLDHSENIIINKGITLRGTGTCNAASLGANPQTTGGPFCATIISTYDGTWPVQNGPSCGTTTGVPPSGTAPGTLGSCAAVFCGTICMQPSSAALTNFGWGGCLLSATPATSNCGTVLDADAAQGSTTIQVHSTANFSVGMWVFIDEDPQLVSTANPTGNGNANIEASPEFLNTSGSPVTFRLAHPDSGCSGGLYGMCTVSGLSPRLNHDIHIVSSIGAGPCPGVNCTLTFDSPLTMAFRQSGSHDARAYWPQNCNSGCVSQAFLQQAGVENLTITRSVTKPIVMFFCAYCWAKNVETAYWINGLGAAYSARVLFTGGFYHDCADCANDGAEYPISIDSGTTEALVDNNIILFGGKGMVGRSATAAVVANNYVDWQRYQPGVSPDGFLDMSVNGSHNAGTHHFLFEGNRGSNCDNDNTHGNAFYHTYFRNHCAGLRTDFIDALNCNNVQSDASGTNWQNCSAAGGSPGPLRAFGPMSFDYWMTYVGNVGGLAGVSTTGNGWVYFRCANGACGNGSESNNTIYMSGWSNPDWKFGDQNLDGTNGTPFQFKNMNFDYVTNGIPTAEKPTPGYSSSLPNSLYLASAPSYFSAGASCTYPWPWVTSTRSPVIQSNSCAGSGLPAKARWDAGTPFVQP